jgi:hypothetical protein
MLPSFLQTCVEEAYQNIPIDTKDQIADALTKPLWHNIIFNVIIASCVASDLHKLPK